MSDLTWTSQKRKISELTPAGYNPRKLSERQEKDLSASLSRFKLADPIVINTNNRIIGGHQRIKVLQKNGWSEVDVRVPNRELTETEEKELNLRLNKNLGEWDFDLLADFGKDMLVDVGFNSGELDKIFARSGSLEQDEDTPSAPEQARTKRGDIYLLGPHRLMCGDSTNAQDVKTLMDGKKASMLFTDPPYNVSYMDLNTKMRDGKDWEYCAEWKDKMTGAEYVTFLQNFLFNAKENMIEMAHYYVWFAFVFYAQLMEAFKVNEIPVDKVPIIWKKQTMPIGWARYHRNYEPCVFGGKGIFTGKEARWFGPRNETGVWEINADYNGDYVHPTQKPVALAERAMRNSSERGEVVLELFGGSGSTLIAAQKNERICYVMEYDPKYCDVIVERWEKFCGLRSELFPGKKKSEILKNEHMASV